MPYVPEAERKRALWMTLADTVARVMTIDDCNECPALTQIRTLLADYPYAAWDGPDLPDILDDGTVKHRSASSAPPLIGIGRLSPTSPGFRMRGWKRLSFWWTARIRGKSYEVYDPQERRWRVLLLPRFLVEQTWPEQPPAQPERPKRQSPRTDYRTADKPLIAEMREMIESRQAKDPTDAARAVVDRAAGSGKPDNIVKRLVRHYHDSYPRT